MSLRTLVGLISIATVGTTACSTSISVEDYDRACEVDADCVSVTEGDKCLIERCGCSFTAISVRDEEQYRDDLNSLVCLNPLNDFEPVCGCLDSVALCEGGVCVGGPPDDPSAEG